LLGQVVGRNGHENQDFIWALDGVSFQVHESETLGLIGPNGAGKTTILKLLSRITQPTSGHIAVKGRVSALIQLGAGFHPDLTGRENVYLNATILGLKRQEIDAVFDDIVAFSELDEFIDMPVKRYSSGMYVRLGFAVAAHVDPDVLLIDEVLAVGDHLFKDKCVQRINAFREAGKTMVIVSHNKEMIQKLCSRTIFLHKGEVIYQGDTQEALDRYHTGFAGETLRQERISVQGDVAERAMAITGVELLDGNDQPRQSFLTAEPLTVHIHFRANEDVVDPVFYSRICQGYKELHGTNTSRFKIQGTFAAGDTGIAEVRYESLNLLDGTYNINVGIKRDHFSPVTYDQIDRAVEFNVGSRFDQGAQTVYLPHQWSVRRTGQAGQNREQPCYQTKRTKEAVAGRPLEGA
jgi:ABC-type polysaccharide/polyol phosphate transport system ATPase subunit